MHLKFQLSLNMMTLRSHSPTVYLLLMATAFNSLRMHAAFYTLISYAWAKTSELETSRYEGLRKILILKSRKNEESFNTGLKEAFFKKCAHSEAE